MSSNHPVTRTTARLADGREIIYFDESPGAGREPVDSRTLPASRPVPMIRFDQLLGEWVGIAGHRQGRTHLPPADQCPLCPSTPQHPTEIPSPDYDVVVLENRFPSFGGGGVPGRSTHGLFTERPGIGRCEVVCFTADHGARFADLDDHRVRTVIEAWVDRTEALSRVPGVRQVFCFTNQGAEIGVTLSHPHGQIYGYPYLTPRTATVLRRLAEYRATTGGNLFSDLLNAEIADGSRIVSQNEHWLAFVPFAARWPLEVHVYPRRQIPDLPATTEAERASLAEIHQEVLRRMSAVFEDTLPAVAGWHQAPVGQARDDFWCHLEVFTIRRDVGKLKYLAGSESGMGAWVNDVTPEAAARRLREVWW